MSGLMCLLSFLFFFLLFSNVVFLWLWRVLAQIATWW